MLPGPDLPEYYVNFEVPNPDTTGYSPKGQLLKARIEGMKKGYEYALYTRDFTHAYDAYGRPTSTTIKSSSLKKQLCGAGRD
ncbi:MAG: hypothetical protein DRH04_10985 [Deltaproteobacteria bacterium]|nr:MAG: hypothetical protein DRH04_10985 [Deltaproteobacteria bacterium]